MEFNSCIYSAETTESLKPRRVLRVAARASRCDGVDGDELETAHGRRHVRAVTQRLRTQSGANGRVEPLQKTCGGVLQNAVHWSRDGQLRVLDEVRTDSIDWG